LAGSLEMFDGGVAVFAGRSAKDKSREEIAATPYSS
jgi:hypothetical protein